MKYRKPDFTKNDKGDIRKAGFEFEFSGVGIEKSVDIITGLFGGKVKKINNFFSLISATDYGDFKIEVDAAILKDKKYEKYLADAGIEIKDDKFRSDLEELMNDIATVFVPYEIVTPPIPLDSLYKIDELTEKIRSAGAEGTKSSFINAFGLHINIEAPSIETNRLLNFLRAYFLLYDWIVEKSDIDFSRRVTPYIGEFPNSYIRKVTDCNYSPDKNKLISDYVKFNPTRNRSLDMMPLFAYIKDDITKYDIDGKELIKARPAFHYRLPNCLIDEPDWSPAVEWNRWVEVDNLAANEDKLEAMCKEFQKISNSFYWKTEWIEKVDQWVTK